ncbi:outer membrane transport energization protein ExbD [Idiomarina loihiensis]|nr:outer membrane transport energization protein ExbD [Idiomarina loihiensis]TDP46778.1 outer membrane transport energization protein ExbD [Idiomarina loihiensis]TDS23049.1 outer membrane transport energization protein ExbD [Idiomarina sp. H2]
MSLLTKLKTQNEEPINGIDLSPLLDVVFILLIFFIVSTVFVRESGVNVDKPESVTAKELERTSILIAITRSGQIIYDGNNIGVSGVRATIEQLLRDQSRPVVLQTDKTVPAELLVNVIDQVKLAGADSVSIATAIN